MVCSGGVFEIDAGREEIWGKYSVEGGYRQDIVVSDSAEDIIIYGKVTNESQKGVPGLILGLCAQSGSGEESPVAFTYSDEDGNYMFSLKKPEDPVEKYIVRVGSSPVST